MVCYCKVPMKWKTSHRAQNCLLYRFAVTQASLLIDSKWPLEELQFLVLLCWCHFSATNVELYVCTRACMLAEGCKAVSNLKRKTCCSAVSHILNYSTYLFLFRCDPGDLDTQKAQ